MAQIVAYHNYVGTSFKKPAAFNLTSVGYWSGTYNLSLIRNMTTITNSSSAAAKGQVAALMYHLGDLAYSTYATGNTGTSIYLIKPAFQLLGYTVPVYSYATGLTEGVDTSFTVDYYTTPAVIKNALNNNRPILIAGFPGGLAIARSAEQDNKKNGHIWVIDGHGSMSTYGEYFSNSQTGQTTWVSWNFYNCLMVHCNLGWDGKANGWYVYGLFDTNNRTLLESSGAGNGSYSGGTIVWIPQKP
jgi:hypothetical protein